MNEIIQKLRNIQDVITIITKLIVVGQYSEAQKLMPNLTQSLGQGIILMTTHESQSAIDATEERNYWIEQIERVSNAIESRDGFRILDVLYFEVMNKISEVILRIQNENGEL